MKREYPLTVAKLSETENEEYQKERSIWKEKRNKIDKFLNEDMSDVLEQIDDILAVQRARKEADPYHDYSK